LTPETRCEQELWNYREDLEVNQICFFKFCILVWNSCIGGGFLYDFRNLLGNCLWFTWMFYTS